MERLKQMTSVQIEFGVAKIELATHSHTTTIF
jgi:hypothetical protein